MAGHDTPVELEALDQEFVVTPAVARLLAKLARGRLERERATAHVYGAKEGEAEDEA